MHSPRPGRRLPREVYLRRRLAVLGGFVLIVAVIAYAAGGGSGHHPSHPGSHRGRTAAAVPAGPPRLVVAMASWQLQAPLSRAVALPVDGNIDVFGGLTGSGNSTTGGVVQLDPADGRATAVGTLPVPVHDAAGAAIGSRYFVFGGGAQALTADAQAFSPDVAQGSPALSIAGRMPGLRADLAAAAAPDGTVYLAGGYDGTNFTPGILSTRNGTTFSTVGQLSVPVRYPAAAVAGGRLLVIGGETGTSASGAGTATDAIQAVDLKTGAVTVAGHLPVPLSHAAAATLNGSVYVFGGRSGRDVVDTVYELTSGATGITATQVGTIPIPTSDMAVATLGDTAYLIGGEGQLAQPGRSVIVARVVRPAAGSTGSAGPGTTGPPFQGRLLIADRGNDRLLLVDAQKQIDWTFPSAQHPAPAEGFYFPDDAFFINHGTEIITNQEDQNTIEVLSYPSGQLVESYGHANVAGAAPGYLNQPDDAFMLNNGQITVADAKNCRILFINADMTFRSAIGHTGRCQHDIPNDVAYPNGDTPLADGNFLVSEIDGSYIDEVTQAGQVVWSVKLPIAYPSDPQQLGPDLYLVADYTKPGGILEFNREGQILWRYQVSSGEGMLDHPSLAEMLPSGLICVNDDYRDRVVIIDPRTSRIVWQYGITDTPGTAPGMLKIPDGFDLLLPNGTTPTHLPASGPGPAPAAPSTPASTAGKG
ncbi:MAG TPA: PQQ-binding-like beta-propeller repeat protein [Acidimicrobiales bacterium]|nr:PQQ-binding-like beta-propeller repeat protein [Acidimicrobiales bacterium]